jgi:histidinol-phosphate aminotransferase
MVGDELPIPAGYLGGSAPTATLDGYLAAVVAHALQSLGVLDHLSTTTGATLGDLANRAGSDPDLLAALLRTLLATGYARVEHGHYSLTTAGQALAGAAGYFTIAVGGFGPVFHALADLATGRRRFAVDVHRDQAAVNRGNTEMTTVARVIGAVLDQLDARAVADLGCGDASKLTRMASRRPWLRGVGIDRDPTAVDSAMRTIARAGVADQVRVIEADITDIASDELLRSSIEDAELVMSFFLLHHMLANDDTSFLPSLVAAAPHARWFVFGDAFPMEQPGERDASLPIFAAAFELFHAVQGLRLASQAVAEQRFADAGLRIGRRLSLGHPNEWLYVLSRDT